MKKSLVALLCVLPLSAQAFLSSNTETDLEYYHDFHLSVNEFSLHHDQNGDWGLNETQLGWNGLSVTTSDSLDFGVGYETSFMVGVDENQFLLGTGLWLHEDIILELHSAFTLANFRVNPLLSWNLSEADIDAEVELEYNLAGLDVATTLFYDLEGLDYTGSEFDLGYRFSVNENISVTPNMTIPFDEEWERDGITAGLSVHVVFNTPSEPVVTN